MVNRDKNKVVVDGMPALVFSNECINDTLGKAYNNAINNLISINTVKCDEQTYNNSGLVSYPPGLMIRAGGDYETPWTRDAAINSWNAASLLERDVARNTLWAVCKRQKSGRLIIQQDDQWWDKVIWITAAWTHFKITGDKDFLSRAYETAVESLKEMKEMRFDSSYGLFQGPSFFNDGIAGYPDSLCQPGNSSSFVLDHKGTDRILALSTNCIYFNAYKCSALMAVQLGRPDEEVRELNSMADSIKNNINRYFWIADKGLYGYFIHGSGNLRGTLDESQESMGLAFAIIFGVADRDKVNQIIKNVHLQPKGITDVWPHFQRFDDNHPGRHNTIVWPLINGIWAHAAALGGSVDAFEREVVNIASLADSSGGEFFEIYDSITGEVNGGWQCGRQWASCSNQTWSATSYLRAIYYGLFGLNFEIDGIRFNPSLPGRWGTAMLNGVKYRNMVLNITINGSGNRIKSFVLDGSLSEKGWISATQTGTHEIVINME